MMEEIFVERGKWKAEVGSWEMANLYLYLPDHCMRSSASHSCESTSTMTQENASERVLSLHFIPSTVSNDQSAMSLVAIVTSFDFYHLNIKGTEMRKFDSDHGLKLMEPLNLIGLGR